MRQALHERFKHLTHAHQVDTDVGVRDETSVVYVRVCGAYGHRIPNG
jgi:hypothetical protein